MANLILHAIRAASGNRHPMSGHLIDDDGNHLAFVHGFINVELPAMQPKSKGRKKNDARKMAVVLCHQFFKATNGNKIGLSDELTAKHFGHSEPRTVRRIRNEKRTKDLLGTNGGFIVVDEGGNQGAAVFVEGKEAVDALLAEKKAVCDGWIYVHPGKEVIRFDRAEITLSRR